MRRAELNTTDAIIMKADKLRLRLSCEPIVWRLALAGRSLVTLVSQWTARRRSRIALLEMTDAQLRDIGLSRVDLCGGGDQDGRARCHSTQFSRIDQ